MCASVQSVGSKSEDFDDFDFTNGKSYHTRMPDLCAGQC